MGVQWWRKIMLFVMISNVASVVEHDVSGREGNSSGRMADAPRSSSVMFESRRAIVWRAL